MREATPHTPIRTAVVQLNSAHKKICRELLKRSYDNMTPAAAADRSENQEGNTRVPVDELTYHGRMDGRCVCRRRAG
jgi:hypothetical protein